MSEGKSQESAESSAAGARAEHLTQHQQGRADTEKPSSSKKMGARMKGVFVVVYALTILLLGVLALNNMSLDFFSFISLSFFTFFDPNFLSLAAIIPLGVWDIVQTAKYDREFPEYKPFLYIAFGFLCFSAFLTSGIRPYLPSLMFGVTMFIPACVYLIQHRRQIYSWLKRHAALIGWVWLNILFTAFLGMIALNNLQVDAFSFLSLLPFDPNFLSISAGLLLVVWDLWKNYTTGEKVSGYRAILYIVLVGALLIVALLGQVTLPYLPAVMFVCAVLLPVRSLFSQANTEDPKKASVVSPGSAVFTPDGTAVIPESVPEGHFQVIVPTDEDARPKRTLKAYPPGISMKDERWVDLRKYPLLYEGEVKQPDISIGDLHGNFLKLVNRLVWSGVLKLTEKEYLEIVEIHRQVVISGYEAVSGLKEWNKDKNAKTVEKNFKRFQQILAKADVNPAAVRMLTLIGDEVADRCGNDMFMIEVLDKLHNEKVPYEILLSNHARWFIRWYESKFKKVDTKTLKLNLQGMSLLNAASVYPKQEEKKQEQEQEPQSDIPEEKQAELEQKIGRCYKGHFKLISYKLSKNKQTIIPQIHAPVHRDTLPFIIHDVARKMGVDYVGHPPAALANTIDQINEKFRTEYVLKDQVSGLLKITELVPYTSRLFKYDEYGRLLVPQIGLRQIGEKVDGQPKYVVPFTPEEVYFIGDWLGVQRPAVRDIQYVHDINKAFLTRGNAAYWAAECSIMVLMWNRSKQNQENSHLLIPQRQRAPDETTEHAKIEAVTHGHDGEKETELGFYDLDVNIGRAKLDRENQKLYMLHEGGFKYLGTDPKFFDIAESLSVPTPLAPSFTSSSSSDTSSSSPSDSKTSAPSSDNVSKSEEVLVDEVPGSLTKEKTTSSEGRGGVINFLEEQRAQLAEHASGSLPNLSNPKQPPPDTSSANSAFSHE